MGVRRSAGLLGLLLSSSVAAFAVVSCSSSGDPDEGRASGGLPNDPGPGPADSANPPVDGSGPQTGGAGAPPPECADPTPASANAEVRIAVRADRGPHGGGPVVQDRMLYGMNIADWQPDDYSPTPNATFLAYLEALEPGVLRWPAGHRSQEYTWERTGGGNGTTWTLTPTHVDRFMVLAKKVGAEPLIGINVKRSTAAAAADMVRYMNVEKKYGVKYFQIGNEPDLTDNITPSPEAYASQLNAWADAMRAVDPSVKIIGPELLTGAHVGGMHGRLDWLGRILSTTGGRIDGLSWHYYPLDSGQSNPSSSAIMNYENLFQETASDWRPAALPFADEVMPAIAAMAKEHAPNAKTWITEFAEDPGPLHGAGMSDTFGAALWVGDALGRYAGHGPGAVLRWIFKTVRGHGYGIIDPDYVLRPTYGAYWLYARHFGNRFVEAKTSALTEIASHAALRSDGALTVMLVNKTNEAKRVHVGIEGFCLDGTATQLTLDGDSMSSTEFTINGHALTPDNVKGNAIAPEAVPADGTYEVEVPPTAIRVVVYRQAT
jgi:hypothetical protein